MFLYTNNEQSNKEIKKTVPFTIASKRIKYLWRWRACTVKNTNHCWKKLKTQINEKTSYVHELEDLLLKCSYFPKYSIELIHIEHNQNIHMETQNALTSQNYLRKEEQSWRLHTCWLIKHYKAAVTKAVSAAATIFPLLSHVWLFATPWTISHQTPLSIGFSRQEYWSGLPFPSPGDLPCSPLQRFVLCVTHTSHYTLKHNNMLLLGLHYNFLLHKFKQILRIYSFWFLFLMLFFICVYVDFHLISCSPACRIFFVLCCSVVLLVVN